MQYTVKKPINNNILRVVDPPGCELIVTGRGLGFGVKPVSYTHLDVYKRQELIEPMTITGIAHRQIGTHLRIPAAYYDRMREERPDLLAYNANTWFKQENSQRMLRTLDGSARAYLSNRYRRIDNIDIAGVTLPILGGLPDIRFESCQITESRMYIKAVNPRLQAEVSPADIVQAGVIISNSEVGLGSVSIQPLIYRLVCSNGMEMCIRDRM